jgi:hypothetical protein
MERDPPKSYWICFLTLALTLLASVVAQAQAATPHIDNLLIELWPEYDRPEILVIYRAELSPETPLPAELTFRLPGYIEAMHAVAIQQDGQLVEVRAEEVDLRYDGDDLYLTFPTSSPGVHFEYYDPNIITRQGQTRQLTFEFTASYAIRATNLEIQEPFQAQGFSLTPPPSRTFIGNDDLTYNLIEMTGLNPGESFELSATYQRSTDALSVERFGVGVSEHAADLAAGPEPPVATNQTLAYVSIGAGVALLLTAGGYWLWSGRFNKGTASPTPRRGSRRRPGSPSKRKTISESSPPSEPVKQPAETQATGGYCYNCGVVLRADSNFCYNCGAVRRKN